MGSKLPPRIPTRTTSVTRAYTPKSERDEEQRDQSAERKKPKRRRWDATIRCFLLDLRKHCSQHGCSFRRCSVFHAVKGSSAHVAVAVGDPRRCRELR